ncbi:hypothetical protein Tco_0871763 [Tanacetum coccineum]
MAIGNEVMVKVEGQGESWHGHVTAVTVAPPEFHKQQLAKKLMNLLEDINDKIMKWSKKLKNIIQLLKVNHDGTSKQIDIEKFKSALCEVDTKMKSLPPTAQLAAQQGKYLAKCFNWMKECEQKPKGPLRFRDTGRHGFKPFRYTHLCQFAPLGGEQTAD